MSGRGFIGLVVALSLVLISTAAVLRGPAPKGAATPADQFSADRAMAVLRELLREEVAHPINTEANRIVRDRVAGHFRSRGYAVRIERDFICNARTECGPVENILALPRINGALPGVIMAAHYDSVPGGPGASDDGVGMAVMLESARALARHPGIAFLITDGEESGLLGAEAFVRRHRLPPSTVFVNVEMRGTSGPSFLFETSRGNAALIRRVAKATPRLLASSLFYTVYDRLPNDTDVTVFKRAGWQALNFAGIGTVQHYHTPLDSLRNVSLRTLQHHGDNALLAARALASAPVPPPRTNAVYFDVLGLRLIHWPERWTLLIALASLMALLISARGLRWQALLGGSFVLVAAVILAGLAAALLGWIAHWRHGAVAWLAYPQPMIAAVWLAGMLSPALLTRASRQDWQAQFAGIGLAWHLAAIALAFLLPGPAFLFLVPGMAISLALTARLGAHSAVIISAVAAAILIFPLGLLLYSALGRTALVPVSILLALLGSTFAAPLRARAAPYWWLAATALILSLLQNLLPAYTLARPERSSITHTIPPAIDVGVENLGDTQRVTLRSTRGAQQVGLDLRSGDEVLRANGTTPVAGGQKGRSGRRSPRVVVHGSQAVIELRVAQPLTVQAWDLTYGIPSEIARRREANQVPSHRGDVTISRREVKF